MKKIVVVIKNRKPKTVHDMQSFFVYSSKPHCTLYMTVLQ